MKILKVLLIGIIFLTAFAPFTWNVPAPAAAQQDAQLRPEDYLPTLADLPQALIDQYQPETFELVFPNQSKLPNFYRAAVHFKAGNETEIVCTLYVGVQDYWQGFLLNYHYEPLNVTYTEDFGDYGVVMSNSKRQFVRFVQGNVMAEVFQENTNPEEALLMAEVMAAKLPESMPHPDTWQLELPEIDRSITLPSKYLFNIYKSEGDYVVEHISPFDPMTFVVRYPFLTFTEAIYDLRLGEYVFKQEVSWSIYGWGSTSLRAASDGRDNFFPFLSFGAYEAHYWVNGETAGIYPFEIQ